MPFQIVDQHLVKNPKTRQLARRIKEHPRYAAGLLLDVWSWAIDAKPDGMIAEVPIETLSSVFGAAGKTLLDDLRDAYFVCDERCQERGLDPDEHRTGRFHDWREYGGKLVEGREKERLRGEHRRGKHGEPGKASFRPVDGCPLCERHPADERPAAPSNGAQLPLASSGRTPNAPTTSTGRPIPSSGRTEPSRTKPNQEEPNQVPPSPRTAELRSSTTASPEQVLVGATQPWRTCLAELARRMTAGNFVTWFRSTELTAVDEDGGLYVVTAPNAFTCEWLEEHYRPQVREVLELVLGRDGVGVEFAVALTTTPVSPATSSADTSGGGAT